MLDYIVAWMRPLVSISRTEEGSCRFFMFQQGRETEAETTHMERQLLFSKSPDKGERGHHTRKCPDFSGGKASKRAMCTVSVMRNSGSG